MLAWLATAALSVGTQITSTGFAAMLLIVLSFNTFGYLMNDLIDLPLDRLDPARKTHPLVTGELSTSAVASVVWFQLPLLALLHLLGGFGVQAGVWLVGTLICLSAYNLWGKTLGLPLLTDLALGGSGFCFTLYGATASGASSAELPLPIWSSAAAAGICLMMINAFHNNLRDLPYELPTPRCTTAKVLGASLSKSGAPRMGGLLASYGLLLQAVLIGLSVLQCQQFMGAPPIIESTGTASPLSATFLMLIGAANLLNLGLFIGLVRTSGHLWQRLAGIHVLTLPLPLILCWIAVVQTPLTALVVTIYAISPLFLLTHRDAWRLGNIKAFSKRNLAMSAQRQDRNSM